MSRWRVVKVVVDDAYPYECDPYEDVVADWLDRAQAKSVARHENKKLYDVLKSTGNRYPIEVTSIIIQHMYDGYWQDITMSWYYEAQEAIEEWC